MLALHVNVMRGTLARVLGSAVGARDFMGRPQENFGLNAKPRPDRSVGFEKTALESLARLSGSEVELKIGIAGDWLASGQLGEIDVLLLDHRGTVYQIWVRIFDPDPWEDPKNDWEALDVPGQTRKPQEARFEFRLQAARFHARQEGIDIEGKDIFLIGGCRTVPQLHLDGARSTSRPWLEVSRRHGAEEPARSMTEARLAEQPLALASLDAFVNTVIGSSQKKLTDIQKSPEDAARANPRLSPEDATALAFLTVEEPVSNSTETPRHDMNNQDRFKGFWDGLDKARQPEVAMPFCQILDNSDQLITTEALVSSIAWHHISDPALSSRRSWQWRLEEGSSSGRSWCSSEETGREVSCQSACASNHGGIYHPHPQVSDEPTPGSEAVRRGCDPSLHGECLQGRPGREVGKDVQGA
eukprot:s148_g38.t1